MGFFLEALFGGLMAGMLYSLVALGFVLIFKASGVFNFAQGAMVLFAALAMARFAEWVPLYLGIEDPIIGNVLAFIGAGGVMFCVAWIIERLVLRHLVNQEGTTLLMATLGITYFLEGLGQTLLQAVGNRHRTVAVGMFQQQQELVGQQPRQAVTGAQAALQALAELLTQQPRHDVNAAAGRVRDHDANGLAGKRLRRNGGCRAKPQRWQTVPRPG